MKKNTAIKENQPPAGQGEQAAAEDEAGYFDNIFEQSILTDLDWQEFKSFFEPKHPGYIFKLRKAFPDLTEAEERLFLLIKTNLTTKEIAALIGISSASVKKTRNRLRKRLSLAEETSLEDYVQEFGKQKDPDEASR
ncbi:MAG: helix-turn-helix transcriptional regulator [Saprospiraceae bacterium]